MPSVVFGRFCAGWFCPGWFWAGWFMPGWLALGCAGACAWLSWAGAVLLGGEFWPLSVSSDGPTARAAVALPARRSVPSSVRVSFLIEYLLSKLCRAKRAAAPPYSGGGRRL